MIIPDYEELFKPYSALVSLEQVFTWLRKKAKEIGIEENIMHKAINDTFLEMAGGKTFPTDGGDTGFDGLPHAALDHYLLRKMVKLHVASVKAYREATEGVLRTRMLAHIAKENERFIAANLAPHLLLNWSKSPVLNLIKKAYKWITSAQ